MIFLPTKKRAARLTVLLLTVGFTGAVEAAVSEDNRYQQIAAKNIFKLQEPPRPKPDVGETPPPAKIILTGITTIFARPLALFEWSEPGQQQKKNYSTLTEGQSEGPIELLRIDAEAGSVTLKNHGITMTLTFGQNTASPAPVIQTRELRLPPPPPSPPEATK